MHGNDDFMQLEVIFYAITAGFIRLLGKRETCCAFASNRLEVRTQPVTNKFLTCCNQIRVKTSEFFSPFFAGLNVGILLSVYETSR